MNDNKEKTSARPRLKNDLTPIPVAIVLALIGIFFILFASLIEYLALAIGIFVIIGASVFATVTLLGKRSGAVFVLKLVFAVCVLATGIITIVFKDNAAGIVCIVFSSAIAVDASTKFSTALYSKQYSVPGKTVSLIISLLTVVAALLMVRLTPSKITDENIRTCSIVIGIVFILDAVGNFIIPFLRHGLNKRIVGRVIGEYETLGLKSPEENSEESDIGEQSRKEQDFFE